ncbi:hypothetical protein [Endozoicomonas sp. ONNA1]|uniref:hypothetical protein n=1 Tax=Endozoicomonas sp. ONNA1 TaxID=2828740 RepID=UPI0021480709|nr:hypothetical protein [Endozoicomonas sp. ONNA1]
MLTKKSLYAAEALSNETAMAGVCFTPKEGTPLAELTTLCQSSAVGFKGMEPSDHSVNELISNSERKALDGTTPHDDLMSNAVKLCSDAVSGIIDVARNHINPLGKDMVTNIENGLANKIESTPRHQVVSDFMPAVYEVSALEEAVSRFQNTPVEKFNWGEVKLPEQTLEFLLSSLKTNIARIDTAMEETLKGVEQKDLLNLYNNIFLNEPVSYEIDERISNLVIHFWSRKWADDIPQGTLGSQQAVSLKLITLKAQSGRSIYRDIIKREDQIHRKTLVIDRPGPSSFNKPITVVGEVYNQWLKKGGCPEVLLGANLLGKRVVYDCSQDEINEFMRAYNANERLIQMSIMTKRVDVISSCSRQWIAKLINEGKAENISKEILHKRAAAAFDKINIQHNSCLTTLSRKIIAEVFYPDTQAIEMLSTMDALLDNDPNLDIREAATLAMVDLMADWLVSQLDVEYVGIMED